MSEFQFAECPSCAAKPGSPYLCAACIHNRDAIAKLTASVDHMRAVFSQTLNKLSKGEPVRASTCEWCGEQWARLDGATFDEVKAHARQHVYRCKQHPMKAERDALLERLSLVEPVFEVARRWCTRPESVLHEGHTVLRNDAEMWLKLRARVKAVEGGPPPNR